MYSFVSGFFGSTQCVRFVQCSCLSVLFCMDIPQLVCLSSCWWWAGLFPAWAHKATTNALICIFQGTCTLIPPQYSPRVELLGHRVSIDLALLELPIRFTKWLKPYTLPPPSAWDHLLTPHVHWHVDIVVLFTHGPSGGYVVVIHCGFNLETSFGKCLLFFNWVVCLFLSDL